MTRQRALILGIMREKCPEHLTADEIFSHVPQPEIDGAGR